MKFVVAFSILLISFVNISCLYSIENVKKYNNGVNNLEKIDDEFSSIEEDVYKSSVKVQTKSKIDDGILVGSGFALDNDRIITAGHFCISVVEGLAEDILEDNIDIIFVNDENKLSTIAGGLIEAVDEKRDICVIYKKNHKILPIKLINKYDDVKIHDKIIIVGGPLGFFPATSMGRVITPKSTNFNVENLNNRLIVFATATFGNSGGPIINANGYIIGIVMAKISGFDNITLGVTAKDIKEFLKEEYGK